MQWAINPINGMQGEERLAKLAAEEEEERYLEMERAVSLRHMGDNDAFSRTGSLSCNFWAYFSNLRIRLCLFS
jgi:hypothetical protein